MKRYFFGTLAVIIALTSSAFVNHKSKAGLLYFYIQQNPNTYVRTYFVPSTANCEDLSDYPCWLIYLSDKGDDFPTWQIPNDYLLQSYLNGLYNTE